MWTSTRSIPYDFWMQPEGQAQLRGLERLRALMLLSATNAENAAIMRSVPELATSRGTSAPGPAVRACTGELVDGPPLGRVPA